MMNALTSLRSVNRQLRKVVLGDTFAAAASVHGLAPLHLPRRPTRPVSYYAFFK